MPKSLLPWCKLYEQYKYQALCLDIETSRFNGPISILGLYQPSEGEMDCTQLIKGKNLTHEDIANAMSACKLIITYNGIKFDLPMIKKEFPGAIPKVPIIDLFLFAEKLKVRTNLKVLENTFDIVRPEPLSTKRGKAIKRWRRYIKYGDQQALQNLLEYNKQDTINLYLLAEKLVSMAIQQAQMENQVLTH